MLSLVPTAWAAETENGNQPTLHSDEAQPTEGNDADVQKTLTAAGGELASGTYTLPNDITLTTDITIPAGAKVTIDLNGYTLTGTGRDSVIVVNGELTVKDSSDTNSGKITGGIGHASDYGNGGGAISIENGGKCTLAGGTLTGNHCDRYNYNAGGVYAKGNAEFYMTGGVITGNTANRQGGGVFGGGSSKIVISGGEISNNTAQFGGGVCYNGTMTMTGGTIKNNIAQYSGAVDGKSWPNIMGGGIKVNSSSPLEFYGGEVFGNKAISSDNITAQGAGIYGGNIKVKGDVKVCDNKRDDVTENIYLNGSAMLEIVGELDRDARLPVTRATQTGRVTSNSSSYSFGGIITADDLALTLETRNGDLYFTKTVNPDEVICTMQVGGRTLGYDSLSAALADLPSDDNVITLKKNIALTSKATALPNCGPITITAESETPIEITWKDAASSFFSVPSDAELTICGNIVIKGDGSSNQSAFDVAGTLNLGKTGNDEFPKVKGFKLTNNAAIYINGGMLNLYSGTLKDNTGSNGGAIAVKNGTANLFGGTISGNTASSGGGLYVANSTVTLSGTKISENIAQKGGGIYNQNGTVTIEQGEISGNWVDGEIPNGGGIYSDGTVTMNGGNINGNAVKVNVNEYGRGRGAAVCNNGKFTIAAGEVSGNYCEQGDAVKDQTTMYCAGLYNEKEMYIAGGTISDNYYKFSADANNSKCFSGVGVSNNGGTLTISGGTITGNGIKSEDSSVSGIAGAGVASTANSTYDAVFNMTGGTITGNKGGNGSGAGLYLENSTSSNVTHTSTATISGGSIVGNTGTSGVYAARANLSISGNPVISGQKTNLYLGSNKITLSGPLTNGAAIGVTAKTPTDGNPVQITNSSEYYEDAARYFIPDAANVIAQANDTGKYVELAYTTATYHKVTLNLSHASVSIGSPTTMVKDGDSCTITIKADKGYTLPEVTQDDVRYARDNDKTTATVTVKPTANTDITITAVANSYKVEFNGNGGTGSMGKQDMTYDTSAPLTANTFTNAGYNFAGWSESKGGEVKYPDGTSVKNMTTENRKTITLYAVWTKKQVIPAFSSSAVQSYKYDGSNKAYNLTSNIEGFVITYKQGEAGVDKPTNVGTYDVIISRAEDATYAAFSQTITGGLVITKVSSSSSSSGSSNPTYSVTTPSKSENGGVAVSLKNARKGDAVTVTVTPDAGYQLDKLTVTDKNGNVLKLTDKGDGKYSFTMPDGKVEVKAVFAKKVETSPFDDVSADAYYNKAVQWAQEKGITDGISSNLFGPKQPCTRSQIVTFLWRAAGSPEPKGTAAGMTDVVPGSYYAKAVAWAVENGITTGTAEGTFSPDATCTRAQAVTFLARAQNAKATGKTAFSDVPADSYFADAVAWAQANGVTTGTSETTFSPDSDCTRAQIVTFLYRANQGT